MPTMITRALGYRLIESRSELLLRAFLATAYESTKALEIHAHDTLLAYPYPLTRPSTPRFWTPWLGVGIIS